MKRNMISIALPSYPPDVLMAPINVLQIFKPVMFMYVNEQQQQEFELIQKQNELFLLHIFWKLSYM